jgi:DNA polymerase-3 subunit delta'
VFLLVSDSPDEIITTILSRAQKVQIPPIDTKTISTELFNQFQLPIADAEHIARLSNGNFLKAVELSKQNEESRVYFENFVLLMRTAWGIKNFPDLNKKGEALTRLRKFSEEMAKTGRENQKEFLAYAQRMIRENFIYNLKAQELNYLSPIELEFSSKFSPFINESNVIAIMEELELAERHIEQNVQAKIIFYDLALKLIMLLKN